MPNVSGRPYPVKLTQNGEYTKTVDLFSVVGQKGIKPEFLTEAAAGECQLAPRRRNVHEIKCPHCDTVFSVDQAEYAGLLEQVRTKEFETELTKRLHLEQEKQAAQIEAAKQAAEVDKTRALADKEAEIQKLNSELENKATEIELARKIESERLAKELSNKELEIQKLQAEIDKKTSQAELERKNAVAEVEKANFQIKSEMQTAVAKKEMELAEIRSAREIEMKRFEEELRSLKEFKSRLGSALIGADLEEHCLNSFNKVKLWAFPNAKFYKDTKPVKTSVDEEGTKGDFIFEDYTEDDFKFLSIMFEMKNQKEGQAKGKKNDEFFAKLDMDRKKKGCEFAVLVTQLEPNNPLYNDGIVDVSYAYEKMYVIRPQLFIPLITFLRSLALNNVATLRELKELRDANIDFTKFEANLAKMQAAIAGKAQRATKSFEDTLKDIDAAIAALEKAKIDLENVAKYLGATSDEAKKVTVKALTKGSPSMEKKFKELGAPSEELDN